MIRRRNPDMRNSLLILHREGHVLVISCHHIILPKPPRLNIVSCLLPIILPTLPVHPPQLRFCLSSAAVQVVQLRSIVREFRARRISFRRQLPLPFLVMNPYARIRCSYRRDERFSIRCHRDPFFFGWPGRHLLQFSLRKSLPPDVKLSVLLRAQIHPLPIWTPRSPPAFSSARSNQLLLATSAKRYYAALHQASLLVHHHDQHPLPIRRQIRMVCHAPVSLRHKHVPALPSPFVRGHHAHMQSVLNLAEQQPLPSLNPAQRGRVPQHQPRLSSQHSHFPDVPRIRRSIGDLRPIRRKYRTQFRLIVMRQLHRITRRKHLHVHVRRPEERVFSTQIRQHPPVR